MISLNNSGEGSLKQQLIFSEGMPTVEEKLHSARAGYLNCVC
jgi:hypothetical protein